MQYNSWIYEFMEIKFSNFSYSLNLNPISCLLCCRLYLPEIYSFSKSGMSAGIKILGRVSFLLLSVSVPIWMCMIMLKVFLVLLMIGSLSSHLSDLACSICLVLTAFLVLMKILLLLVPILFFLLSFSAFLYTCQGISTQELQEPWLEPYSARYYLPIKKTHWNFSC